MTRSLPALVILTLVVLLAGIGWLNGQTPAAADPWTQIVTLLAEDRIDAAADVAAQVREAARKAGDEATWTRALIQETQLRIVEEDSAAGYRLLREAEWPKNQLDRAILHLYVAEILRAYGRENSWRIDQRERIDKTSEGGTLDLETATRGEIFAATVAEAAAAWEAREGLSEVPLARVYRYLIPNEFPPEVRGTLRDAVSYLIADILANSAFWSVEESQDLPRADLARLVEGTGLGETSPADAAVHPLTRMAAVLGDLEAWHASQGKRAATLEARRERLRLLGAHFSNTEDRQVIRRDLEEHLAASRDLSWWAMGMATLADFVREEGNLAEARKIAREAYTAYPKSPGGLKSLDIAEQIEAPHFEMTATAGDALGQRSIRVRHKNLEALRFRAYAVDLEARIAKMGRHEDIFPNLQDVLKTALPTFEWTAELPATPDFEIHQTYLTPPIQRAGAYLVVATPASETAAKATPARGGHMAAVAMVLGDLVLLSQPGPKTNEVTALSGSTGKPLPGVQIQAYSRSWETGVRSRGRLTTGPDGRVRVPVSPNEQVFLLARQGKDIAYTRSETMYPAEAGRAETLFFTDRAIYRPLQTVSWKVLVYDRPADGEPVLAPGRQVRIRLLDAHGQEAASGTFKTNEFGTATGSFSLPPGRPLGMWQLESSSGDSSPVRVEEYKRPTFEVTLDDPADAVRLGRPATFSGTARYYFGLPVSNGEVRWRVLREPVWIEGWWWGWRPPHHGERVVATGTAALDEKGAFRLTFTPAEDDGEGEDAAGVTWRFRVEAEVTDAGGETRQADRSFRLGKAAVEARIALKAEAEFLQEGKPAAAVLVRTSLDGAPRAGEGSWTLAALRQPEQTLLPADQPVPLPPSLKEENAFRTPGDTLRPREEPGYEPAAVLAQWEDGERIASGTVRHGTDGRAEAALPALAPGAYRLRYQTVDEFGTPVRAQRELIVTGPKTPLALPLVLAVDRSEAHVGGIIRLLAHSGLPGQNLALEIYRNGILLERRELISDRDASLIEIPVDEDDRGGLGFKLIGVRDHQLLQRTAQVFVPWDDRKLAIELSTFRDKIRPGAKETWTVTVRAPKGEGKGTEAAAAELLALMYDRSLDLFQKHELPDVLSRFPNRTAAQEHQSSLGSAQVLASPYWERESRAELRGDRLRLPVLHIKWVEMMTTPADPEEARRLEKLAGRHLDGRSRGNLQSRAVSATAGGAVAEEAMASQDMAMAPPPPPPPAPPPPPVSPQAANREKAAGGEAVELRRDFRETAFWQPRLLTGADGSAQIEFTVPDSVTSWNFWVQAVTRDLRSGSLSRRVESVKELMVRPYLPRFLREGDRAELKVAVDNASEGVLSGEVELDVIDPETEESLLGAFGLNRETARLPFKANAGGGTTVTFPLTTPRRPGPVAFRVTAITPGARDGELRPLPVLPSRVHLAQSRTIGLREKGRREVSFPDLARDDDSTRIDDQLVVTVDAQLFHGLLAALPYLVDYPYECTEQTLNRFVSTGILTGLFDRHPAVARMAAELAKRETPLETWDAADPNRRMSLEETPWLAASQGLRPGEERSPIRVLDPRVARAEQATALAKLAKAQLGNGAFPWWPGGPESPYMTIYLLYGFAKAKEFGVEVPEPMIRQGWQYLGEWARSQQKDQFKKCGCWPLATFLNYAASASPASWTEGALSAAERKRMLEISYEHRLEMTPYLKAMLSLTLHRMGRAEEGKKVLNGLLESATTTPDEGTFWTKGKHGWVWYEDAIESHAFVLRAVQEILPTDPRRHGLVQWLFLNKQLSHWRSTRDTAEVIYAVAAYLEKEGQLGKRETATVRIGNRKQDFVWEPDRYTGKENRIVIPGEEVGPDDATIAVEKQDPGFLFATATWHFSTEKLPEMGDGDLFQVERRWFRRVKGEREVTLRPLKDGETLRPGDEVEVHLLIRSRAAAEYVHLRDPRPAGLEPDGARSGWRWGDRTWWYEETRDSGMNFFFENLPAGEYTLKHRVRANLAGTFRTGPATIQSMYAPEHTAYSAGREIIVASVRIN